MVELIQELLLSNNCVIIPGFGAFIGNYNPAEVRLMENRILPPAKVLVFNRSLQTNDGLLINALASESGISYREAEEQVQSFAKSCIESLHLNKSLILKDVGRFLLDADQKIQFQPYQHKNFLLNSFGLEALALEPIHRLKDKEAEIRENYQRILHPERMEDAVMQKRPSHIPYWIMAALAVAFLTSTVTWNIHKSRVNKSYTSMLPFDSAEPLVKLPVKSILKQEETLVSEKAIAKPEMTPAIVSPSEVKTSAINNTVSGAKMSYIVVGAFFDELHAGKVMAEAESKGYVVHMTIDHNNTIYRINVEVETQNVSATLQKIKSDFNERAWVFCNNCSLK